MKVFKCRRLFGEPEPANRVPPPIGTEGLQVPVIADRYVLYAGRCGTDIRDHEIERNPRSMDVELTVLLVNWVRAAERRAIDQRQLELRSTSKRGEDSACPSKCYCYGEHGNADNALVVIQPLAGQSVCVGKRVKHLT